MSDVSINSPNVPYSRRAFLGVCGGLTALIAVPFRRAISPSPIGNPFYAGEKPADWNIPGLNRPLLATTTNIFLPILANRQVTRRRRSCRPGPLAGEHLPQ
jgi:hypothetical protein